MDSVLSKRFWSLLYSAVLLVAMGCQSKSPPRPAAEPTVIESPVANPAPPQPEVPTGPRKITFEELDIGMEPDTLFEAWMMNTKVRERLNQRVIIQGFISGAIFQLKDIREFPLMREVECPYGPGGQAHHVMNVIMRRGSKLDFTRDPIHLEGFLILKPYTGPNGKTWSLYELNDAVVAE